ncbi:unnamed protein product [Timema podura]|uniref:Uncharacterized protein n=1 Tax=Timema podura TaxID=61482 RepID=A0ABN7PDC0_TIMPD|nr:unnamed protein product [Timema podura]
MASRSTWLGRLRNTCQPRLIIIRNVADHTMLRRNLARQIKLIFHVSVPKPKAD